ncbi:MAG: hypothetical protein DRN92_09330 [Thermoproteota archaeon]|nr:MAG: hypothetical protein DRN92_09330 [Candidatus Korarchaeota archaeon]
MEIRMGRFLALGHLTIDEVFYEGRKLRERLGGSVAYGSLAAISMGWEVSIVSVVGEDMPKSFLQKLSSLGADISHVKTIEGHSTRFRVEVSGSREVLSRPKSAPALRLSDIPREIEKAHVIFLGSVGKEISVDLINKIKNIARGLIAIDLQGFIREFGPKGEVSLTRNKKVFEASSFCDVIHLSREECVTATGTSQLRKGVEKFLNTGAQVVSITMGEKGGIVADKEEILYVPAIKPERVVDDVGAGDVFLAVLSICLAENIDLKTSSAIASAAASLSTELDGPSLLDKSEIERRSKSIMPLITYLASESL